MSSKENKFLIVWPNVVLNPLIETVILKLEKHFEKVGLKAFITSGVRTADDQLHIIQKYLKTKGMDKKYPEAISCAKSTDKLPNGQYAWQMGWSALLNCGIIINPPLKAILLMDYVSGGINKKGKEFNQTMHANGLCVDIGGGADGLSNEVAVVKQAQSDIPEIISFVVEHNNNCLHLNLKQAS